MKKHSCHNPVGVSRFTGLALISPFIAGSFLFVIYPFISSIVTALTADDAGIGIFRSILTNSEVKDAALVTMKYTALLVPMKLIISLLAALLLNMELKGIGFFRTAFYIPSILGANLAVIIMWQYLFTSDGLVNQLIQSIGLSPVSWYGDTNAALLMIVILRLWEFGSTMVIFLAALRDIPHELYDAAKVDGCGGVRAFFLITLPQLKNVIFLNLILQTIAAMQEFNAPYILTGGGPMGSTRTIGMLIYDEMFSYGDEATANAVSWLLFVLIAAVVFVMYKLTERMRDDAP